MTETEIRPALPRHAPGTPCWASLLVHGLAESQHFYHELFGWEFSAGPEQRGPYVRAVAHGYQVAGLGEVAPGRRGGTASWLPYLASDDADATADLVRHCGGTVAVGPLDAEDVGRMAVAADPSGAAFGIWQAAAHLGFRPPGVALPGTPVWFELVAPDTAVAGRFYPTVFGYAPGQDDGPPDAAGALGAAQRLTLCLDGTAVAGVSGVGRALPPDRGPHWQTYFAVRDADAAAERVVALGGRVGPLYDSAYGRTAEVTDPEGARFSVIAVA